LPKPIEVGQHQGFAKMMEHAGAIVALAKLDGGHVHQRSHVPTKALRRRIVEMVRHVRDGEARIFEQARGSNEASRREILLGRGELRPEESAHERAWEDIEAPRETPDSRDTRRRDEQHLEEAPAIVRHS